MPKFLGKIVRGCNIFRDSSFPVTPAATGHPVTQRVICWASRGRNMYAGLYLHGHGLTHALISLSACILSQWSWSDSRINCPLYVHLESQLDSSFVHTSSPHRNRMHTHTHTHLHTQLYSARRCKHIRLLSMSIYDCN